MVAIAVKRKQQPKNKTQNKTHTHTHTHTHSHPPHTKQNGRAHVNCIQFIPRVLTYDVLVCKFALMATESQYKNTESDDFLTTLL